MTAGLRRIVILLAVALFGLAAAAGPNVLGPHRIYHTPYYVLRGEAPGPTVLIEAGIHGDEPAGTYALEAMLRTLTIKNGTAIFIPRLNAPALARERRYINYDLNRAFGSPGRTRPYEFALARDLMSFARAQKIDYMVTLHEAHYLYDPSVERSLGQTLCYGVQPMPALLDDWLPRLNALVQRPEDRFHTKYFPIATSSTEVMTASLHLKGGFCVETWRNIPLDRRIAYQRAAVETFLQSVGIGFSYAAKP